jgi:hypothetical protein
LKNLEEASKISNIAITIEFFPYFLDKNIPIEGISFADYMISVYGDAAESRINTLTEKLRRAG